jgi:hypothetical protein
MHKSKTNSLYLQNEQSNSKSHVAYYPIETKRKEIDKPILPSNSNKAKEREIDTLRKTNDELKEREEVYIDKLMKLEEGLENQHR